MNLSNLLSPLHLFQRSLKEVKELIEKENEEVKRANLFYNGVIITLYGSFEFFVDGIASSYLDLVLCSEEKEVDSENHQKPIKEHLIDLYIKNMGEFLSAPQRHSNVDNSYESINQIFASFSEAINHKGYSKLKKELLMFHGGNMKSDTLFDFFNSIKLQNVNVMLFECSSFSRFVVNELGIEDEVIDRIKTKKDSDIYLLINNLVEERNKIAHQGFSDEKISLEEIQKRTIPYLSVLSEALFRAVCKFVTDTFSLIEDRCFENPCFIEVINNSIVCHSNEKRNIKEGDYFVIKRAKGNYLAKVLSIQENSKPLQQTGEELKDFGFGLDENVKENYELIYHL